jgi:hypothetical protein
MGLAMGMVKYLSEQDKEQDLEQDMLVVMDPRNFYIEME